MNATLDTIIAEMREDATALDGRVMHDAATGNMLLAWADRLATLRTPVNAPAGDGERAVEIARLNAYGEGYEAGIAQRLQEDIAAMVDRFLCWRLPDDFHPDAGISFTAPPPERPHWWPVGTNLLTAAQARAMFLHCMEVTPAAAPAGDGVWVPREPTEAMQVAALKELSPLGALVDWQDMDGPSRDDVSACYRAMIAAAPTSAPTPDRATPGEREALATLQNVLDGKISGRISEWPQLRPAIAWAVERLTPPIASSEAAPVCYRLETPNGKWQWMDAPPSQGTLDLARIHGYPIHYAYDRQPAAAPGAVDDAMVAARDALPLCDWSPENLAAGFSVQDQFGEHTPCNVFMPDGAGLDFNHHAINGVDQARAEFVAAACNAMLERLAMGAAAIQPAAPGAIDEMVERMLAKYREIEPSDPVEFDDTSRAFMRKLLTAAIQPEGPRAGGEA